MILQLSTVALTYMAIQTKFVLEGKVMGQAELSPDGPAHQQDHTHTPAPYLSGGGQWSYTRGWGSGEWTAINTGDTVMTDWLRRNYMCLGQLVQYFFIVSYYSSSFVLSFSTMCKIFYIIPYITVLLFHINPCECLVHTLSCSLWLVLRIFFSCLLKVHSSLLLQLL